jgi:hypothetical protein
MCEDCADLFERVARPVKDRRGGSPKIVRRPSLHRKPGNKALSGFLQIIAVEFEDRRGRIGFQVRPQQFQRQAASIWQRVAEPMGLSERSE